MKVLLFSDMAHTGFGRVGREVASGLVARGHELRIVAINWRGVPGEIAALMRKQQDRSIRERLALAVEEILADPLLEWLIAAGENGDGMGHNLTALAVDGNLWPTWKPEAIIVVGDPQALKDRLRYDGGSIGRAIKRGVPVLNYVPIEGEPLPLEYRRLWEHVTPVAMSSYGQTQLERLLERPVALAYHGVSAAFRPLSPTDPGAGAINRDSAKEAIGHRGRTIVLRTDRHILRKNYGAFFRIMSPLLERYPDLLCIVHCGVVDEYGDLREVVSTMPGAVNHGNGVWTHPQVRLTQAHDTFRGLTDEELRVLYAAADLYVSPTMAEGFGLCLAESLACGTPVVATDYSAIAEVVGPGGILVPPTGYMTSQYALRWALVDEVAMSAAVEGLIRKPALRRQLAEAGRKHVAQFTWAAAIDVIDRLITERAAAAA